MNRITLLAAALLGISVTATPSAADDRPLSARCEAKADSLATRLTVSRLFRIHGKARNYSPRLTHQLELSSPAPFPWRLAGSSAVPHSALAAVCTRCEP